MPSQNCSLDQFTILVIIVIISATVIAFFQLFDVFILAVSAAIVMLPLHHYFSRRIGTYSSVVFITLILFIISLIFVSFIAYIFFQNQGYIKDLFMKVFSWLSSNPSDPLFSNLNIQKNQAIQWIENQQMTVRSYITEIFNQLPLIVLKITVFFLSFALFILKGDEIYNTLLQLLPERFKKNFLILSQTTVDTLFAIFVVHFTIAAITVLLAIPFFYFLGYGHVLFLGVSAGILKLIPIIGPSAIIIVLGIYAISIGDIRGFLFLFFIGYPIVCAMPDLYIRPVMMGKRACIHPIIMWIGFFGGLITMGLIGFVLGPLILALLTRAYTIFKTEMRTTNNSLFQQR